MAKVIDFFERGQRWHDTYRSPDGDLRMKVSSRGRLEIQMGDRLVELDLIETVSMLSQVSDALDSEFGSALSSGDMP